MPPPGLALEVGHLRQCLFRLGFVGVQKRRTAANAFADTFLLLSIVRGLLMNRSSQLRSFDAIYTSIRCEASAKPFTLDRRVSLPIKRRWSQVNRVFIKGLQAGWLA